MKRSIRLGLIFLILALGSAAAEPEGSDSSPTVATYRGGRVSLAEFEDWVGFMDLMYPLPKTQYPDRAGWEGEIYRLAKARATALWRRAGIRTLQRPTNIEVESARVETLQQKYVGKRLFEPLYRHRLEQWEEAIRARYEEVKAERFAEPPVYEFRHIFINTNPERGGRSESEAEERIRLVQEALARGASFEEVAGQYSDSEPSRRGALLGPVSAVDLSAEFATALAALQEGEISPPFQTKHGYERVQLVKKHPLSFVPFDKARDELAKEIPPPHYQRLVWDYLEERQVPAEVFYPLEEARAEEYDEATVLFRVGELEYRLGDMYWYFDRHPRELDLSMPLNFNIEDLNFERFLGLAFFDPKSFNSWINAKLQKEKIFWVGRRAGLFDEPEFRRYLTYLEEDTLARALSSFHTKARMEAFDQEGNIEVNQEALQPFIEKYLAAKGLSF